MGKSVFLWCLYAHFFVAYTQNQIVVRLHPTIVGKEYTLELKTYYKGKYQLVNSFPTKGKDSLVIDQLNKAGLYSLSFKGFKNEAEFIYNPKESLIIEIDNSLLNGQMAIEKSPENTAYSDLIKIDKVYNHYLDSVQSVRRDLHTTTPDFYGRCFYLDSLYDVVANEKNARLTYLQYAYPNTYTSEVLVPLSLIPVASLNERRSYQTPDAYLSAYYFKYYKVDKRLLNHYALEDAIISFLSKYTYPDKDGIKKSIDKIQHTFSVDTSVGSHVSELLIKTFLDAKSPELALYVMGNSADGCSFDLGEKQNEYLANYSHVQVGNQVDDIILNDILSQPVSLSNTCKKTELTILLFWTSWCTHCKKFLPELKELLAGYKGKVGVFAVSLDETPKEWTEFVNTHSLTSWVHVSELKKIEKSSLAPRFMVTHTPSMYLLNKERRIVAKNLDKEQLLTELQSILKKD